MIKTKILVVDDEPVFCRNFKSFIELHDYACVIARNGKEGMEVLLKEKPNLVILDVLMPNMDGYTMLREMRKSNLCVPCIVVTAREKLKDLFDVEQIARFIPKPFALEKMRQIIEDVLREEKEKAMNQEVVNKDPLEGKKILLIEDELKLAENLKTYFELFKLEVKIASNGEEGLKQIDSFCPDLVISDIIMPELDGYSMLKQLKKKRSDLPVIILTGKDRLKDLFEVEGIEAFLTKPFNLVDIENKVREIFAKKRKGAR